MSADLTSSMGKTPYFSPSIGSAKRLNASRISPSSCGVTLCSFASLDWRVLGAALPLAAGVLRFGGYRYLLDTILLQEFFGKFFTICAFVKLRTVKTFRSS